jgi:hypothetical protein
MFAFGDGLRTVLSLLRASWGEISRKRSRHPDSVAQFKLAWDGYKPVFSVKHASI